MLLKTTHILLIEDNKDHAELIERSLKKGLGRVKIYLSETATHSYQTLENTKFDLILSDYYLPDSHGIEHIQELHKKAPATPIVIITGQGDEKTAAHSIQAGAEDYIVKTREALEALPRILRRVIVKHRSHQKKKHKEIRKHLGTQDEKVKMVLGEVEQINKQVRRLKRINSQKITQGKKRSSGSPFESLSEQIESLKKFVQKILTKK